MVNEGLRKWKAALAAHHQGQRRRRYRPRARGVQAVRTAGMVRTLPPAKQRPAEAGRHTHEE